MKKSELVKWAIKGLRSEIDDLEKAVFTGYRYIQRLENGEKIPVDLTKYEIEMGIRKYKEQIEELSKQMYELKWELSFDDTYETKGE